MPEDNRNKSIFNRLFIIVVIVICLLICTFFFILHKQNTTLDISDAFTPSEYKITADTRAPFFTDNIVVSNNNVLYDGIKLSSSEEYALVFDIDNNKPVFAQNIYDKAYPASLTKIMTAITAIKYGNMSDTVVMSEEDFMLEEGSQVSSMKPGDTVTMEQLFKTLLVHSANDAAMAIARHISGSVSAFVDLMNQEAVNLGMISTRFENPHGLHSDNHYTCAYDVYLMLNEALKYTEFTDTIHMNYYMLDISKPDGTVISYRYDSTDKYLTGERECPSDVVLWGGKTGTTPQAGSCLAVVSQNKKGIPYITVVMNADNSTMLYDDMSLLLSHIND